MTQEFFHHQAGRWRMRGRRWFCCGLLWELLLSDNFPERETWRPVCPRCGRTVKPVRLIEGKRVKSKRTPVIDGNGTILRYISADLGEELQRRGLVEPLGNRRKITAFRLLPG